jgi:rhodanese-related sulfurtransferase
MTFIFIGSIFLFAVYLALGRKSENIVSPSAAYKLLQSDSGIVILDVRTPEEYKSETGHLANAILLPVRELEGRIDELQKYKNNVLLVYCRTGHRSTTAAAILKKHGYNVRNMEGGITRWNAEHLPTMKEKQ